MKKPKRSCVTILEVQQRIGQAKKGLLPSLQSNTIDIHSGQDLRLLCAAFSEKVNLTYCSTFIYDQTVLT